MSETQTPTPEQTGPMEQTTSSDGMVDMSALLAEISARLVTVGSLPLPDARPAAEERREEFQCLVFRLAKVRYAIEIGHVRELVRHPVITRVPGLPDWVVGVTNLHGDIMSVVDLARFLSVDNPAQRRTMLVTRAADQQIGLMVDEVDVIYNLASEQIISPPFTVDAPLVPYLRGAIEHQSDFIRLLDCSRLLLGQQMQQFS